MNSQIFQNTRCKKASHAETSLATLCSLPTIQWLSAALLMMAVILFPERPAWGNDFDIIFGKAANSHILKIEQVRIYYQNPNTITADLQPSTSMDESSDQSIHGQQDNDQRLALEISNGKASNSQIP